MQCTRYGCSRQLRSHSTTGVCSSNCESADAPAAARAFNVKAPTSAYAKKVETPPAKTEQLDTAAVMAKFRAVTKALNLDEEAILAEAARGWLDGLRGILDGETEG